MRPRLKRVAVLLAIPLALIWPLMYVCSWRPARHQLPFESTPFIADMRVHGDTIDIWGRFVPEPPAPVTVTSWNRQAFTIRFRSLPNEKVTGEGIMDPQARGMVVFATRMGRTELADIAYWGLKEHKFLWGYSRGKPLPRRDLDSRAEFQGEEIAPIFSPSGDLCAAFGHEEITLVQVATGKLLAHRPMFDEVCDWTFTTDGKSIIAGLYSDRVVVLDAAHLREQKSWDGLAKDPDWPGPTIDTVAPTPDGHHLVVGFQLEDRSNGGGHGKAGAMLLGWPSLQPESPLVPTHFSDQFMRPNFDGGLLAVCEDDGVVTIYNLPEGTVNRAVLEPVEEGYGVHLGWTPDGNTLIAMHDLGDLQFQRIR